MAKVKEIIDNLKQLDQELDVYFDCPTCENSNVFKIAKPAIIIHTQPKRKDK